jgi:hypothetical protein
MSKRAAPSQPLMVTRAQYEALVRAGLPRVDEARLAHGTSPWDALRQGVERLVGAGHHPQAAWLLDRRLEQRQGRLSEMLARNIAHVMGPHVLHGPTPVHYIPLTERGAPGYTDARWRVLTEIASPPVPSDDVAPSEKLSWAMDLTRALCTRAGLAGIAEKLDQFATPGAQASPLSARVPALTAEARLVSLAVACRTWPATAAMPELAMEVEDFRPSYRRYEAPAIVPWPAVRTHHFTDAPGDIAAADVSEVLRHLRVLASYAQRILATEAAVAREVPPPEILASVLLASDLKLWREAWRGTDRELASIETAARQNPETRAALLAATGTTLREAEDYLYTITRQMAAIASLRPLVRHLDRVRKVDEPSAKEWQPLRFPPEYSYTDRTSRRQRDNGLAPRRSPWVATAPGDAAGRHARRLETVVTQNVQALKYKIDRNARLLLDLSDREYPLAHAVVRLAERQHFVGSTGPVIDAWLTARGPASTGPHDLTLSFPRSARPGLRMAAEVANEHIAAAPGTRVLWTAPVSDSDPTSLARIWRGVWLRMAAPNAPVTLEAGVILRERGDVPRFFADAATAGTWGGDGRARITPPLGMGWEAQPELMSYEKAAALCAARGLELPAPAPLEPLPPVRSQSGRGVVGTQPVNDRAERWAQNFAVLRQYAQLAGSMTPTKKDRPSGVDLYMLLQNIDGAIKRRALPANRLRDLLTVPAWVARQQMDPGRLDRLNALLSATGLPLLSPVRIGPGSLDRVAALAQAGVVSDVAVENVGETPSGQPTPGLIPARTPAKQASRTPARQRP